MAPQGTSFDSMYTVTHFSTSAMEPEDVKAVALSAHRQGRQAGRVPPRLPVPLPQAAVPKAGTPMAAGRLTYMASCAGCHGMDGEGIPNVSPAMKGNAALAMDNPQTLINVVLNGTPTQIFKNGERMYAMPPLRPPPGCRRGCRSRDLDQSGMGRPGRAGDGGAGKRSGNSGKINGIMDGPATRCGRLFS